MLKIINFLRKIRAFFLGVKFLKKSNFSVFFLEEGHIEIKLPSSNYLDYFYNSRRLRSDRSIHFSKRPSAEALFRNIIFEMFKVKILDKNKSVIDIGAWISDNSLVWAKMLNPNTAKVYAIDPSSENISFGKELAALNDIKNISYHENICSDISGTELFFEGSIDHAVFNNDGDGKKSQNVTTTIDEIVTENHQNDIGLFHIDVEGFEELVIKGAEKVIMNSKPIIVFEQHVSQEKPEIIFKHLIERDYRIYMINEILPGCALDCRNFMAAHNTTDFSDFIRDFDKELISTQIFEAVHGPVLISVD
jgi:FkbM family methyltransferase